MIGRKLWTALGAAVALVVGGALGAPEAKAHLDEGFDAQNFKIALDPYAYMTVNGARSLLPLQFHVLAEINYAKNPLKFTSDSGVSDKDILKEIAVVDLGASMGLLKFGEHGGLQVGASIPLYLYRHGVDIFHGQGHVNKTDFGDLRTQLKATFMDREEDLVGVAARLEAIWPTGDGKEFTSNNDKPSYLGSVIVEKKFGAFRIGAEAGYQFIESQFGGGGLQIDDKLHIGVGAGFEVMENLEVVAEVFHWTRIENPWDHEVESPVEGGIAVKYTGTIFGMAGVNAGLNNGLGAPDFRFVLEIGFTFGGS